MSCGLALAIALMTADPSVALTAAQPPAQAGAPVSVAAEPLFADIIARSQRLKAQIDGWAASGAANAPGFFAAEPYTVFKGEAERLANPRARSAKLRAAVRTDAPAWGRFHGKAAA